MARSAVQEAPRADRRKAILLAAEKLFAQAGYHAVTIRSIAQEAGVPLALLGDYFGAKHELFVAIFEHWAPTCDQRLSALAAVPLDPANPGTLPAIVRAFALPVIALRASAEGEYCALLVARQMAVETEQVEPAMRSFFDPLARAFINALCPALPQAGRAQVCWAYQFALGALQHHLSAARVHRLSDGACVPADPAATALLVDFIVGGLRAALPWPGPLAEPAQPAQTAQTAHPAQPRQPPTRIAR